MADGGSDGYIQSTEYRVIIEYRTAHCTVQSVQFETYSVRYTGRQAVTGTVTV